MKKKQVLISMLLLLVCFGTRVTAQCIYPPDFCMCVELDMISDTIICPGTTYTHNFAPNITIPPGCTIDDWQWSPSAGVSPASGSLPTMPGVVNFSPSAPTNYTLTLNAFGPNILNNGDFSAGASCFNTAYLPYMGTGGMSSAFGYYVIAPDVASYFSMASYPDHSSSVFGAMPPYNMMMVDGDLNPGTLLWEETNISLCPDVDYEFSFWLENVIYGGTTNNAKIRVVINGVTFGPFSATSLLSWERQSLIYHSPPGGGPISIQMYDDELANNANDFAIDDIAFRRSCKITDDFFVNLYEGDITGPDEVCEGSKIKLTGIPAGGSWSASGAASVDASGNVFGLSGGSAIISYYTPDGCTIDKYINVLSNPVSITGLTNICALSTLTLTGTPSGLIWNETGPVTGTTTAGVYNCYTAGGAVFTYTDPVTGCFDKHSVIINENPYDMEDQYICIGDTFTIPQYPGGGTWVSSVPSTASVNAVTGLITGITAGTTIIKYTTPAGCSRSMGVHVYNCATGVAIGGNKFCEGGYSKLIGLPRGGTWSSGSPAIATVHPTTGVVTAVPGGGGGMVTFTYTVGGISVSINVKVSAYATACIETKFDPLSGYSFDFTSSCGDTATITYYVTNFGGGILGYPSGYTQKVVGGLANVTSGTIASLPHGTYPSCAGFFKVCITSVTCGDCTWRASCCDSLNTGSKTPSAVLDINGAKELQIIPNPSRGMIEISGNISAFPAVTDMTIELVDILGKTVQTAGAVVSDGKVQKTIQLNTNLANGMYLLKITGNGYSQVDRIILNR